GRAALRIFAAREAVDHLTRALALDDTPDDAHLDLARAYELIEDAPAASEVYHRLLARATGEGAQRLAARALAGLAMLEAHAMHLEEARQLIGQANEAAAISNDQPTQVDAALSSALIHTYATDLDTALDRAL